MYDKQGFMRKISAVGLFCCDKFDDTPKPKVIDLSKKNKFYFNLGPIYLQNTLLKPRFKNTLSI